MSTDATPSWSGYIFQGEVALCKALEKINEFGCNIPDSYCLKLEEDEDFSLTTDIWETFQVKAYTTHNYTKYKKAWDDMMKRFPANAERNYLYLHKDNVEVDKFNVTLEQSRLSTNVISGFYTLDNVINKIDDLISDIFPDFDKSTIELKRNYCLVKIHKAIKHRHQTKIIESFRLKEIKQWIIEADTAFNEEIAWINIIKVFFKTINDRINNLNENIQNELKWKTKLESYVNKIDQLDSNTLKNVIKNRLNAHKPDRIRTIEDLITYFSHEELNRIIIKCFEKTNLEPLFDSLSYDIGDGRFQLSLINLEINHDSTSAEKKDLHKYCDNIEKKNVSDINTFITKSLDLESKDVKEILRNIMNPETLNIPVDLTEESKTNITDIKCNFNFKDIDNFINQINNEGIN